MKITGIKIHRHESLYTPKYPSETRSVGPMDVYGDYMESGAGRPESDPGGERTISAMFLSVTTDEGVIGTHGPIEYRAQLLVAVEGLAPLIVGKDPMNNRMLWDIMSRFERHSRSGIMLMAISAVDNALWDLKGKILGLPVWKILGGGRDRIRPYVSMLGFSVEPERAVERALMVRDMGVRAQKWFFRYGPSDGSKGIRKNLNMAFALREALGEDYELMFDCWMGWSITYAKTVFRELEAVHPMWVEEVLRPHMMDGYRILKAETSIPLSAGEHIYTRMEANQYLKDGIFDVMQSDPEWCGGITETLKIGDICEMYGTRFIPHGHSVMPALQVEASLPPEICPYAEYLLVHMGKKAHFFANPPMIKDGWLHLNTSPGLGEELAYDKITATQELREFSF